MTIEDELRTMTPPAGPGLVPPPDLADAVLHGVRRRRRAQLGLAVTAVVAAVALAVPLARPDGGGGTDAGTPTPGPAAVPANPTRLTDLRGGPVTVTAFTVAGTGRTSVLDPATGRYAEVPYEYAEVSPDGRRVAVHTGLRTGVVDRAALLRRDTRAIRWTGLPGGRPSWSPDGTALLATGIVKDPGLTFTLVRWDLATGSTSTTTLVDPPIIGDPVWAPDSRDYLYVRRGAETADTVQPAGMQVVHPDGTLGPVWEGPGGVVAYSPSRRRAAVDPGEVMSGRPIGTGVVDTRTGDLARTLPAGPRTVGWYDEDTVVRLTDASELQVVDATTGAVDRVVRLAAAPALSRVQLGRRTGRAPGF